MAAGKKTGGRKKGSLNKATVAKQITNTATVAKAQASGISPLEVMLQNMRHFHQVAQDAEALLAGKTAAEIIGTSDDMSPEDQLQVLLAEVRKAADLRDRAQACARDVAPFVHARISPVDSKQKPDEAVPLAERLKAYAREDAIAAGGPKVVELKRAGK